MCICCIFFIRFDGILWCILWCSFYFIFISKFILKIFQIGCRWQIRWENKNKKQKWSQKTIAAMSMSNPIFPMKCTCFFLHEFIETCGYDLWLYALIFLCFRLYIFWFSLQCHSNQLFRPISAKKNECDKKDYQSTNFALFSESIDLTSFMLFLSNLNCYIKWILSV